MSFIKVNEDKIEFHGSHKPVAKRKENFLIIKVKYLHIYCGFFCFYSSYPFLDLKGMS